MILEVWRTVRAFALPIQSVGAADGEFLAAPASERTLVLAVILKAGERIKRHERCSLVVQHNII